MAAPGLGVGDIIDACRIIYDCPKKFADAPKDLRIIADKAWSLKTTLQRIKYEGILEGNIVRRAEDPAEEQLEVILNPLRTNVETLAKLVEKYGTVGQGAGGYCRRLMFALKESGSLADRRRQIELHEQTLQMWYMTVIFSSLRRIECGIDDLLKVYETMRELDPRTTAMIREKVKRRAYLTTASRSQVSPRWAEKASHRAKLDSIPITVTKADAKPLKKELLKRGLSEAQIDANLDEAIEYLLANKDEQDRMEKEVRQRASTMHGQSTRYEDRRPTNSSNRPYPYYHNKETRCLNNRPHEETIEIPDVLH
ncbi:hypothetical protein LTR70_006944 [Exophiala xenobiotica]|uniref:Uncharacterized protein n=1 Tax=Lithohypha guttulata TaxID=1690604 RepID=A0ABR0K5G5_9EURO|nr:hypothetical protein LTR24_006602 [Lithohypha guttulata]KAK5314903.1 hypothetical protein LTR70_006944 [Exophiala xenobiotica]